METRFTSIARKLGLEKGFLLKMLFDEIQVVIDRIGSSKKERAQMLTYHGESNQQQEKIQQRKPPKFLTIGKAYPGEEGGVPLEENSMAAPAIGNNKALIVEEEEQIQGMEEERKRKGKAIMQPMKGKLGTLSPFINTSKGIIIKEGGPNKINKSSFNWSSSGKTKTNSTDSDMELTSRISPKSST